MTDERTQVDLSTLLSHIENNAVDQFRKLADLSDILAHMNKTGHAAILSMAFACGNVEIISSIVRSFTSEDFIAALDVSVGNDSNTPMHHMPRVPYNESLYLLIKTRLNGKSLALKVNQAGLTCLHIGAGVMSAQGLQWLLDIIDVEAFGMYFKQLINRNSDKESSDSIFHYAACNDDPEVMLYLFDFVTQTCPGWHVEINHLSDKYGNTPLHYVVDRQQPENIKAIYEHMVAYCDPLELLNIKNAAGLTVEDIANKRNTEGVYKFLQRQRVNAYLQRSSQFTIQQLWNALKYKKPITEIKRILRCSPGFLYARDASGRGLLHLACLYGHMEAVKYLLDEYALASIHFIFAPDVQGNTALYYTAGLLQADILCLLMQQVNDKYAALALKNNKGETVFMRSFKSCHYKHATTVIAEVDEIDKRQSLLLMADEHGCTPVHVAATSGDSEGLTLCRQMLALDAAELSTQVQQFVDDDLILANLLFDVLRNGCYENINYLMGFIVKHKGVDFFKHEVAGNNILHIAFKFRCKETDVLDCVVSFLTTELLQVLLSQAVTTEDWQIITAMGYMLQYAPITIIAKVYESFSKEKFLEYLQTAFKYKGASKFANYMVPILKREATDCLAILQLLSPITTVQLLEPGENDARAMDYAITYYKRLGKSIVLYLASFLLDYMNQYSDGFYTAPTNYSVLSGVKKPGEKNDQPHTLSREKLIYVFMRGEESILRREESILRRYTELYQRLLEMQLRIKENQANIVREKKIEKELDKSEKILFTDQTQATFYLMLYIIRAYDNNCHDESLSTLLNNVLTQTVPLLQDLAKASKQFSDVGVTAMVNRFVEKACNWQENDISLFREFKTGNNLLIHLLLTSQEAALESLLQVIRLEHLQSLLIQLGQNPNNQQVSGFYCLLRYGTVRSIKLAKKCVGSQWFSENLKHYVANPLQLIFERDKNEYADLLRVLKPLLKETALLITNVVELDSQLEVRRAETAETKQAGNNTESSVVSRALSLSHTSQQNILVDLLLTDNQNAIYELIKRLEVTILKSLLSDMQILMPYGNVPVSMHLLLYSPAYVIQTVVEQVGKQWLIDNITQAGYNPMIVILQRPSKQVVSVLKSFSPLTVMQVLSGSNMQISALDYHIINNQIVKKIAKNILRFFISELISHQPTFDVSTLLADQVSYSQASQVTGESEMIETSRSELIEQCWPGGVDAFTHTVNGVIDSKKFISVHCESFEKYLRAMKADLSSSQKSEQRSELTNEQVAEQKSELTNTYVEYFKSTCQNPDASLLFKKLQYYFFCLLQVAIEENVFAEETDVNQQQDGFRRGILNNVFELIMPFLTERERKSLSGDFSYYTREYESISYNDKVDKILGLRKMLKECWEACKEYMCDIFQTDLQQFLSIAFNYEFSAILPVVKAYLPTLNSMDELHPLYVYQEKLKQLDTDIDPVRSDILKPVNVPSQRSTDMSNGSPTIRRGNIRGTKRLPVTFSSKLAVVHPYSPTGNIFIPKTASMARANVATTHDSTRPQQPLSVNVPQNQAQSGSELVVSVEDLFAAGLLHDIADNPSSLEDFAAEYSEDSWRKFFAADVNGMTPFHYAILYASEAGLKKLINLYTTYFPGDAEKHKQDIRTSLLQQDVLQVLLKSGRTECSLMLRDYLAEADWLAYYNSNILDNEVKRYLAMKLMVITLSPDNFKRALLKVSVSRIYESRFLFLALLRDLQQQSCEVGAYIRIINELSCLRTLHSYLLELKENKGEFEQFSTCYRALVQAYKAVEITDTDDDESIQIKRITALKSVQTNLNVEKNEQFSQEQTMIAQPTDLFTRMMQILYRMDPDILLYTLVQYVARVNMILMINLENHPDNFTDIQICFLSQLETQSLRYSGLSSGVGSEGGMINPATDSDNDGSLVDSRASTSVSSVTTSLASSTSTSPSSSSGGSP